MDKRDKGRVSMGRFLPRNLLISLLLAPAFLPISGLAGCSQAEAVKEEGSVVITRSGSTEADRVDIFIYDRKSGGLDSYQQMRVSDGENIVYHSGTGDKVIACIMNEQNSSYRWEDVKTLDKIRKMRVELDREEALKPVMSGMLEARPGSKTVVECTPLLAKVVLRTLRCDFSSRDYADEKLENVRIYLTNVCNGYSLFPSEEEESTDYMNIGGLDRIATARMKNRDYVFCELSSAVGPESMRLDREFLCYPDTPGEETAGSPYTRLVIEGSIAGETCWYPITLNRRDGGKGVERDCRHVLDVTLTRKGADNPWTPVGRETAQIDTALYDWTETEVQDVGY